MKEDHKHGPQGGPPPELANLIRKPAALELLFEHWNPQQQTERIHLTEANGRILAEDIYAQYNIPVIRASRMDGIAVHASAFAEGMPDTTGWKSGVDYIRADTGDDFDDAFDAVIAIENVELLPDGGLRFKNEVEVHPGTCVKPGGADVRKGSLIAKKGIVLRAQSMAAVAMAGVEQVSVVKKPVVGFIPTGSELVQAGSELQRGQNFDTNSILVRRMLLDMGAEPLIHPIVKDDPAEIQEAFDELFGQCDILIINAGTSKGGEDYSHAILEHSDHYLFHGVAAVPGRPMSMAVRDGKALLNISGPAFAAFYSMDWAVRPLVCRALGIELPKRERITATLEEDLRTAPIFSQMIGFVLSKAEDGTVIAAPLALRGAHSAGAAAALMADAVYVSEPGEAPHPAGSIIELELLKNRSELGL